MVERVVLNALVVSSRANHRVRDNALRLKTGSARFIVLDGLSHRKIDGLVLLP
jgi:hypothetical protein